MQDEQEPTNVLFIGVDGLRPQLGCYGAEQMVTPHLDALARDGWVFARHYCQMAVCAPSRINVFTGLRPDTTGVVDQVTPLREALPNVLTLPQHFRNHGYETVALSKVYHRRNEDPPGWSRLPRRRAEREFRYGYVTEEALAVAAEDGRRGPPFEAADVADSVYRDGVTTELAVEELGRLQNAPFFLAVGYHRPHLPFCAPAQYWNLYDEDALPLPSNDDPPQGVTPYSLTDFPELRRYSLVPREGPVPEDLARRLIHGYAACVSFVDAQVGRLVRELARLGLRERTLILLWSDHACKLGEHGSWSKHTNFEVDTRVPLVVTSPRAPDRASGQHVHALTENVDICPTVWELCGLPVPDGLDGTSLVPLMKNPGGQLKEAAFSQYRREQNTVMGYAMRTHRYRYVEWRERASGRVLERELYDHEADPHETANVAAKTPYVAAAQELAAQLDAYLSRRPDTGVTTE